jgi:hypothetical protein
MTTTTATLEVEQKLPPRSQLGNKKLSGSSRFPNDTVKEMVDWYFFDVEVPF